MDRIAVAPTSATGPLRAGQRRIGLVALHNAPVGDAAARQRRLPEDTLPPALTRLLRRCPLLPSELSLLESRLHALLAHASPDELGGTLAHSVAGVAVGSRGDALERALRAWDAARAPPADGWQRECGRVVASLVTGLGQLHRRSAVGIALHTLANLALGPQGATLLAWAQHAVDVPHLLQDDSVLPWLRWLCRLPLPSLRGNAWVEPLIACMPSTMEALLHQADTAHETLHRHLQLPSSSLRLVLLATAWVLWFRQQPHAAPTTALGRHVARLPSALDQLDQIGGAARRLLAAPTGGAALRAPVPVRSPAPTSSAEATRLLQPALPVALASAALAAQLPRRRAAGLAGGVAAVVAGGSLLAWAMETAYRSGVAELGQALERQLFLAPATRETRALGTALALRAAVLPDSGDAAAQARVVLDLPLAAHAPSFRQGLRLVCGVDERVDDGRLDAAAGWALRRAPRSVPATAEAPTARMQDAAADDQAALIESLWALRDTAIATGAAMLPRQAFLPADGSPLAVALLAVRQQLMWLYRQDDFLETLYAERTPPSTLAVANATLTGTRAMSGAVVALHPQASTDTAWSAPTEALLGDLQRAVRRAGGCFDNAVHARLDCALAFYLDQPPVAAPLAPAALDPLIHRLERALQQRADGRLDSSDETAVLRRLQQQVAQSKAVPIRGLAPAWSSWRPDPRSHLGHNLALARSLLLQVSQHAEVIALCWHHHADPAQLVYPAHGAVRARAAQGTRMVDLFEAGQPPAALGPVDTMLRGIATLLHAPVRSDGRLHVPEMLAYYAAPLPAVPMEDAEFDACLDALARQLAPRHEAVGEPARMAVAWDTRTDSPLLQDHQRLLDLLWSRFDALPATLDEALAHQALSAAAGSPLDTAWQAGQQGLQQVFEQPGVWLEMRRLNASFHSLRVGADGLTARQRGSGRSVVVADGLAAPLQGAALAPLEALYRMTDRLGRFSPGTAVPLGNALQFHGALPAPASQPCPVPALCTQAQLLDAIARVHARWQRHGPPVPRWQQASNELQDLRRLLEHRPDAASDVHRPTLGTRSAAELHWALPAFARLVATPAMQQVLQQNAWVPRWVAVDTDGNVQLQDIGGRVHRLDATASLPLAELRGVAAPLGGQVRSDGRVNISDTLAAHGGCGPQEVIHADGAARCVERLLAELRLGMRADLLHAADALGAADLEQVRLTTSAFLSQRAPGEQTLLEYLARPLLERGDMAWDQLHRASHFVAAMARGPRAMALQTALLRDLGWYMGSPTAPTSPTLLASLTRVAIVLDLGPPSDRYARVVLGYRLHKYSNWGRTFAGIRLDFHEYLHSMGRVSAAQLGMAATLALQDHAPELLSADVPANLVYANTIASINFVSGVHLAERIRRGLAQQMRFSELITLAADLAGDDEAPDLVKRLTLEARRLPTLDWFVFRQLERQAPLPVPAAARIEVALQAFDARVAELERAISDVLAPLPYRMPLVEAEIRRVFPRFPGVLADEAWNSTDFRLCNDNDHFGRSFPFHDIVAAGVLRNGSAHWRPCRTFVPSSALG